MNSVTCTLNGKVLTLETGRLAKQADGAVQVRYGNTVSRLVDPQLTTGHWRFEVVFDYGQHPGDTPSPSPTAPWGCASCRWDRSGDSGGAARRIRSASRGNPCRLS